VRGKAVAQRVDAFTLVDACFELGQGGVPIVVEI
jgi:hypothetical protein